MSDQAMAARRAQVVRRLAAFVGSEMRLGAFLATSLDLGGPATVKGDIEAIAAGQYPVTSGEKAMSLAQLAAGAVDHKTLDDLSREILTLTVSGQLEEPRAKLLASLVKLRQDTLGESKKNEDKVRAGEPLRIIIEHKDHWAGPAKASES